MKEKSYTELMKLSAMNRSQDKERFMQNLYIEMLLTEIQLKIEKEKLTKKIDAAIDRRDRQTFLELSQKFRELTKRFGT
ncbi:IDEAL domain-containing protein [Neobacillus sp. SM06]|uniref:IDEAL domain-containing protein n=1 Tax=Neobacillus sp. SM06 TaxID=3422492 RepID=UPI003D28D365